MEHGAVIIRIELKKQKESLYGRKIMPEVQTRTEFHGPNVLAKGYLQGGGGGSGSGVGLGQGVWR